jgi:hypothetical protein
MRKLMLRMVSVEGDLAGRRVPMADLDYSADENPRVQTVIERLVDARLIVKGEDYIEPAHDALVRAWKTLHEWIHAAGRDALILGQRLGPDADQFAQTRDSQLLWSRNPNLAVAARALKDPQHPFNAREVVFVRKSVSRNRRRKVVAWALAFATVVSLMALSVWALLERATAEEEKERALLSLFEGLSLNMNQGQPGSLCARVWQKPPGDGKTLAFARAPAGCHARPGLPVRASCCRASSAGGCRRLRAGRPTLDDEINGSDSLPSRRTPSPGSRRSSSSLAARADDPRVGRPFAKIERMEQVRRVHPRGGHGRWPGRRRQTDLDVPRCCGTERLGTGAEFASGTSRSSRLRAGRRRLWSRLGGHARSRAGRTTRRRSPTPPTPRQALRSRSHDASCHPAYANHVAARAIEPGSRRRDDGSTR